MTNEFSIYVKIKYRNCNVETVLFYSRKEAEDFIFNVSRYGHISRAYIMEENNV